MNLIIGIITNIKRQLATIYTYLLYGFNMNEHSNTHEISII